MSLDRKIGIGGLVLAIFGTWFALDDQWGKTKIAITAPGDAANADPFEVPFTLENGSNWFDARRVYATCYYRAIPFGQADAPTISVDSGDPIDVRAGIKMPLPCWGAMHVAPNPNPTPSQTYSLNSVDYGIDVQYRTLFIPRHNRFKFTWRRSFSGTGHWQDDTDAI
jgi:hypothetical protein